MQQTTRRRYLWLWIGILWLWNVFSLNFIFWNCKSQLVHYFHYQYSKCHEFISNPLLIVKNTFPKWRNVRHSYSCLWNIYKIDVTLNKLNIHECVCVKYVKLCNLKLNNHMLCLSVHVFLGSFSHTCPVKGFLKGIAFVT